MARPHTVREWLRKGQRFQEAFYFQPELENEFITPTEIAFELGVTETQLSRFATQSEDE